MYRLPFDQAAFSKTVMDTIGKPWSNATDVFPSTPEADTVVVAKALYKKYLGAN